MDADLGNLYLQARAARPELDLAPDVFLGRVAAVLAAEDDRERAIARLHASDLYLACACAAGVPDALAAFEREVMAAVPAFVGRFRAEAGFADEVSQSLRTRLLAGATPRIAEYTGRGPLRAWVRISATRVAVDLLRARGAHPTRTLDEHTALDPAAAADLQLVKARYREHFQEALDRAFAALSPKQRTLLRMHHVDGYSLDRLATAYQVHRATIARWLADARAQIVEGTHRHLGERFAMSASEVDSLAALVRSQIEISVERLLK